MMLLSLNPEPRMHWMKRHPSELLFGVMQWQTMQVVVEMQCSVDPGIGMMMSRCWRDRMMSRCWRERGEWGNRNGPGLTSD